MIKSAQGDIVCFLLMLSIYKYQELLFVFQICFAIIDYKTEVQTESQYIKVKTFNVFKNTNILLYSIFRIISFHQQKFNLVKY